MLPLSLVLTVFILLLPIVSYQSGDTYKVYPYWLPPSWLHFLTLIFNFSFSTVFCLLFLNWISFPKKNSKNHSSLTWYYFCFLHSHTLSIWLFPNFVRAPSRAFYVMMICYYRSSKAPTFWAFTQSFASVASHTNQHTNSTLITQQTNKVANDGAYPHPKMSLLKLCFSKDENRWRQLMEKRE